MSFRPEIIDEAPLRHGRFDNWFTCRRRTGRRDGTSGPTPPVWMRPYRYASETKRDKTMPIEALYILQVACR